MSSKMPPKRLHVAMLNSLRAISMLGGGKLNVIKIAGQYSRTITHDNIPAHSRFVSSHLRSLNEMFSIRWSAKGDKEAGTVDEILTTLEKDGCPELFVQTMTIIKPWSMYNDYTMETEEVNIPFVFHPHPFKPSVFSRLKGRMPSLQLYARMKEIRKILSAELDDETKKRWRDILLINYPHEKIGNQETRQLWGNEPYCFLLKESKGKFTFMEVDESREA